MIRAFCLAQRQSAIYLLGQIRRAERNGRPVGHVFLYLMVLTNANNLILIAAPFMMFDLVIAMLFA